MLYRLALPVVSALLASLVTAIIFIPICVYITLPRRPEQKDSEPDHLIKTALMNIYHMTFDKFNIWYNKTLRYFLSHRIDLAFILIVLLSATYFYAFEEVDFSGRRDEKMEEFHMRFRFPDQFTLQERDSYFNEIENVGTRAPVLVKTSNAIAIEAWVSVVVFQRGVHVAIPVLCSKIAPTNSLMVQLYPVFGE
mgnify:CR=1 FL=1